MAEPIPYDEVADVLPPPPAAPAASPPRKMKMDPPEERREWTSQYTNHPTGDYDRDYSEEDEEDEEDEGYSIASFDTAWLDQEIQSQQQQQQQREPRGSTASGSLRIVSPTKSPRKRFHKIASPFSTAPPGSSTPSPTTINEKSLVAADTKSSTPTTRKNHNKDENVVSASQLCTKYYHSYSTKLQTYWRNQRVACIWFGLYVVTNMLAFFTKAHKYATHPDHEVPRQVFGSCVAVARGSASALNFNACLILLPLCKHVWTWVQTKSTKVRCTNTNTNLAAWLPLDHLVQIHTLVGMVFGFFCVLHCLAHACDFYRFAHHPYPDDLAMLFPHMDANSIPVDPSERWEFLLSQPAAKSGIVMVVCMILAYSMIVIHRRSGGYYNLFWYSHHLLLVMLATLMFHGRGQLLESFQSIYWVGLPLLLYGIPRLWREVARLGNHCRKGGSTKVLDLSVLSPGNVVVLRLTKPSHWNQDKRHCAGMYANLNIPYLSMLQWHPFTISSAPSDDYIEFHIRPVGDWTGQLYQLARSFSKQSIGSHMNADDMVPPAPLQPSPPGTPLLQGEGGQEVDHPHDIEEAASGGCMADGNDVTENNNPTTAIATTTSPGRNALQENSDSNNRIAKNSRQWLWDRGSSLLNLGTLAGTPGSSTSATATNRAHRNSSDFPFDDELPRQQRTPKTRPFPLQDLVVKVDGPLGTPSLGYSNHRVVALIGAGIGITPMFSIVKELLVGAINSHQMSNKTEHVYLIWTFRDRCAMDWFASLIHDVLLLHRQQQQEVEQGHEGQKRCVLEMRFYVTNKSTQSPSTSGTASNSFSSSGGVSSRPADEADDEGSYSDSYSSGITGTGSSKRVSDCDGVTNHEDASSTGEATSSSSSALTVQYGRRPHWSYELSRIHRHHQVQHDQQPSNTSSTPQQNQKCGIFVCGPSRMAKEIRSVSTQISQQDPNFHFYCREERFSF